MTSTPLSTAQETNDKIKSWFEQMITELHLDKLLMENGIAPEETKEMYEKLILGGEADIYSNVRASSSIYFIKSLVSDYLVELVERKIQPRKLALELSDAKVLVWAEIEERDEVAEDMLLLAEAKVNAKYDQYGFHISSTVVESCDNLAVPSHYLTVIPRANV
jgi:hypothetical protein